MLLTRRRFAALAAGSLLAAGGSALAVRRWQSVGERVVLDDETVAGLLDLARGAGTPSPSPDRLEALSRYLRRLPAASPLLAAEYVRLVAALKRLSAQVDLDREEWASPDRVSPLLEQYYAQVAGHDLVRYAGHVLPRGDVAVKDLLLFVAGEPGGRIEVLAGLQVDQGDPRVSIEAAAQAFSSHCVPCHQSTDVRDVSEDVVRAVIEGGPLMSSRRDLRQMTESEIASVVAFLNR